MLEKIKSSELTCLFLIVILLLSFFQINVMANVTLSVCEESSLSNPSITPEEGKKGTKFTYKIKYTGDKAPIWKYVFIKDLKLGWRFFEMKYVSGEFDEGAIYKFDIKLYTPGDYKYYFVFTNEEESYLRYPKDKDQYLHGPTVLEDDIVEHYAVIICGGGGDGDDAQEPFERSATRAHNALRKQGYNDKNIYHLRKDTSNERVDKKLNYDTAKYALEVWLTSHANKNSKCLVYLSGHGTDYGSLLIDEGSFINDFEVAYWLRNLECKSLTVVVECCFAGNFIDDLSGQDRIIITSTNCDLSAYYRDNYEPFFSKSFFEALDAGKSYGGAWEAAEKTISESLPDDAFPLINKKITKKFNELIKLDNDMQIPLIDDNGDGKGHGTAGEDDLPLGGDGALAKKTYPGYDHDGVARFRKIDTVLGLIFEKFKNSNFFKMEIP